MWKALVTLIAVFLSSYGSFYLYKDTEAMSKVAYYTAVAWYDAHFGPPKEVIREPEDVDFLLTHYAKHYNLPVEIVFAIAKQENYKDWYNNDAMSPKGALGIMQVMPQYHVGAGKTCEGIVDNWTDLVGKDHRKQNVQCGVKYLRRCFELAYSNKSLKTPEQIIRAAIKMYNNSDVYATNVVYAALAERLSGKRES